mmetsp:Transcript_13668/g.17900  ORF Transcript_13668/g.17900 Transcript_13668/m.17900 type:complete len:276 (-) Transcript_13668:713-1540(-)
MILKAATEVVRPSLQSNYCQHSSAFGHLTNFDNPKEYFHSNASTNPQDLHDHQQMVPCYDYPLTLPDVLEADAINPPQYSAAATTSNTDSHPTTKEHQPATADATANYHSKHWHYSTTPTNQDDSTLPHYHYYSHSHSTPPPIDSTRDYDHTHEQKHPPKNPSPHPPPPSNSQPPHCSPKSHSSSNPDTAESEASYKISPDPSLHRMPPPPPDPPSLATYDVPHSYFDASTSTPNLASHVKTYGASTPHCPDLRECDETRTNSIDVENSHTWTYW